ncbi:hypothetical protein BROUX41_004150 [Berkeleyomyces rouxiae]|uniref:uncharacterized protein n=1 Tax=Berkeleyomyces rouxiae TaxID=2035830 RepID=UPI003B7FF5BB
MAPFQTTVHPFESDTPHSCAYESGLESARNALVFIGGLGDGPHTIDAARSVSKALADASDLSYSLFEIRMQSSFDSFGNSSLKEDVANISAFVKYLRQIGRQKIVLLGHSTGCQDIMMYNKMSTETPPVDGFILQGPVSDREALLHVVIEPCGLRNYRKALEYARDKAAKDELLDWMPRSMIPAPLRSTPFTVYRFLSLADKGGDDDFFSSDLSTETVSTIWSSLTKPTLVLHSDKDEYVPEFVEKGTLISRWKAAGPLISPLSGVIPGANHTVAESVAQTWFCNRIVEFLQSLKASS